MRILGGVAVVLLLLSRCTGISFDVPAGRAECVLEHLRKGENLKGSMTTLDSSDIDLHITTASGRYVFSESKTPRSSFAFKAEEAGNYRFCFTASQAKLVHKTVDLVIEKDYRDTIDLFPEKSDVSHMERKIRDVLKAIKVAEFEQARYRQVHEQHRYLMVNAYRSVKFWGCLEIATVAAACVVQILFLRGLFPRRKRKRPAV